MGSAGDILSLRSWKTLEGQRSSGFGEMAEQEADLRVGRSRMRALRLRVCFLSSHLVELILDRMLIPLANEKRRFVPQSVFVFLLLKEH